MHEHQWRHSIPHSVPGALRRFACPCGAWGYQQIDRAVLSPIRAYKSPPEAHQLALWEAEAQRRPSIQAPIGSPAPERPWCPVPAFAWYRRDDGHWVRARE